MYLSMYNIDIVFFFLLRYNSLNKISLCDAYRKEAFFGPPKEYNSQVSFIQEVDCNADRTLENPS